MKNVSRILAAAVLTTGLGVVSASAQTDTQTLNYDIQAVTLIETSGAVSLVVNGATAVGGGLASDTDATATYAITNNDGAKKVQAALDLAMPTGVTLTLALQAPSGATSTGAVALTATAQDLVTGVGAVDQQGLTMTYVLGATVAAGVATGSRTVTLTVLAAV